ncbi:MAG TPA: hypothetical protein PKY82_27570 [Pyrinomonadaceae bacterium]|nr:hypothetical protein [Pyrinomonadaceae bacterium]
MKSNPEIEVEEFFNSKTLFTTELLELFNNNPNLKGYIQKNFESEPIKTITELQNVNETIEKGLAILKNGQLNNEIFEGSKSLQEKLNSNPFFGEKAEINSSDFFGFISGTRFISVYLPPGLKYFIVKEKENYKILLKP